jgi:pyridoxamine 5'-phosphate oxidase
MDLYQLRESYSNEPLDDNSVHLNPFNQFRLWFEEALKAELPEPNAMILNTVDLISQPQSRAVLLKGVENENFIFFTNYQSQKGIEIENNPNVALNFLWLELERQIRINGTAVKISSQASDEYFYSRPIGSQIGAHVSNQSKAIANRQILEDKLVERTLFFENNPITRPENWGGYKVDPISIEFWKGRPNRLHDRILYKKDKNNNWQITRLSP